MCLSLGFIANFFGERKAHPPLGAGSEVSHGVKVVTTGNHVNRAAPSGWMVRLVSLPEFSRRACMYDD